MVSSNDLLEQSIRPYKNKAEFDLHYPISYKPTIGIVDNSTNQSISLALPFIQQSNSNSGPSGRLDSNVLLSSHGTRRMLKPLVRSGATGLTTYKKNIYSDLEFKEYFDWYNMKQLIASLVHSFSRNYFKLLISQPFEISKIIQQVGSFKKSEITGGNNKQKSKSASLKRYGYEDEDDSDDDDSRYFARADETPTRSTHRKSKSKSTPGSARSLSFSLTNTPTTISAVAQISPVSLNTLDVISALISKEGPRGILKAINTSFFMNTLQYTIQSWISGFLAGALGIPDPLFVDLIHSPNVNLSLALSVISNVLTSLLLSAVSLVRMKFIITNSGRGVRSLREILQNVPKLFIFTPPQDLIVPSITTSLIKSLSEHYPEYLLTASLQINKYNSPIIYNSLLLIFKICGLFVKLPFETLYNRAQVNYLLTSKELPDVMRISQDDLTVKFGGYYGYLSTLYYIVAGSRPVNYGGINSIDSNIVLEDSDENELNQGWEGIFRGWNIGLVRLCSRFTLKLLSSQESNGVLIEEQF